MGRKLLHKSRLTIFIKEENLLHVFAAATPEGLEAPPHGAISAFFDGLIELWLAGKLRKEQQDGNAANPPG